MSWVSMGTGKGRMIKNVMTKEVCVIKKEATLMEAAALLSQYRIRQLPVVDDAGILCGYLNRTDIKFAIAKKGTSANTYVQLDGRLGGMVPYLKVYGRKGEKCRRCRGVIERIKLNGRGTHFCKICQKNYRKKSKK